MPSVLIFYHFFHPDDVVSALHKNGLAQGLSQRGWDVEAMPCNRGCRDSSKTYPASGNLDRIAISRIWRPNFKQSNTGLGRIINALWMIAAWSLKAFQRKPDVIIIGTDPVLSILTAIPWRLIRPKTRIVHWCFDLHPEGAVSEGIIKSGGVLEAVIKYFCGIAYRKCDLLVDLGDCMRSRLQRYPGVDRVRCTTIAPWALTEPEAALAVDSAERKIVGDARLVLMYSGNLGRCHCCDNILSLARKLRNKDIQFTFSVRGNAVDDLKRKISPEDSNISVVDFAPLEQLEQRLSAADIHIVSLRDEWTGLAIPSKFFGAIASGRPVLFSGSRHSAIARWIEEFRLGWVLTDDNIDSLADEFQEFSDNPESLKQMFPHCHEIYQKHFSEKYLSDRWDGHLRELLQKAKDRNEA